MSRDPTAPDTDPGHAAAPASSLGGPAMAPIANLQFKAALLMVLTVMLAMFALGYYFYARGTFEHKQTLVLVADDSEGISIGMDLTFSGFPIGTVRKIELTREGQVHIIVQIPDRNAHWLRNSSIFTMVRNLLGATSLKAYTSSWSDPPLPDNAVRTVLFGDASAEIPQLMASARNLLGNLTEMTAANSSLAKTLNSAQLLGHDLSQSSAQGGALRILLGEGPELKAAQSAIERTNKLLGSLNSMTLHADQQVFGKAGIARQTHETVEQMSHLLEEIQQSMKKVDAILADAKVVSGNVAKSTVNLQQLRDTVESDLRQINSMLGQLQGSWPFAKEHRIELP